MTLSLDFQVYFLLSMSAGLRRPSRLLMRTLLPDPRGAFWLHEMAETRQAEEASWCQLIVIIGAVAGGLYLRVQSLTEQPSQGKWKGSNVAEGMNRPSFQLMAGWTVILDG